MLANKGVTVLAISLDAKPPCVLVTSPDGWEEICPIKKWFKSGDPPKEVHSPLLADIATFEVLGVNEAGEAVMVRYDVKLQGMGPPIPRNADGSFGSKAGRRLEERLQAKPAQLPAVFDKEGMS